MTTEISAIVPAASRDVVDRPHPAWWLAIIFGLTLLAFQGFSPEFYGYWTSHVHSLPAREVMRNVFLACIPIHVFEAVYVYRVASGLGLRNAAMGWALQTLLLGFPSTHLMRRRARAMRSARA